MDNISQQRFERIVAKTIGELTSTDKVFLRARREYLDSDQVKKYKDVLNVGKAKKKVVKKVVKTEVKKPKAQVNPEFAKLISDAKEIGVKTEGLSADQLNKAIDAKLAEK